MFVLLLYVGSLLISSCFLMGFICLSHLLPNPHFVPRPETENKKKTFMLLMLFQGVSLTRVSQLNLNSLSCLLTHCLIFSNVVVLKLGCAFRITSKAWWKTHCWAPPHTFWFSGSGVGPKILHFSQAPRWCPYCWSRDYTLRTMALMREFKTAAFLFLLVQCPWKLIRT